MTPQEFATLTFLIDHAGRLVTKDELRQAIWDDPLASDASLKVCIGRIRKALGDNSKAHGIIQTMHRKGYRFVANIRIMNEDPSPEPGPNVRGLASDSGPISSDVDSASMQYQLVGRDDELAQLEAHFHQVQQGNRQIVFIRGEAGIGKSAFVHAFVESLEARGVAWTASGQCLIQHLTDEAYHPILEAVGRLVQQPGRDRCVSILASHAPSWLMQLPIIAHGRESFTPGTPHTKPVVTISPDASPSVNRASPFQMLREMEESLIALSSDVPLVLVLDDLHMADQPTLNLISSLAQHQERAKLMLIATYCPADTRADGNSLRSLKRDLQSHGKCSEISLQLLGERDVRQYLANRYNDHTFADELSAMITYQTDGNPLFVTQLIQFMQERRLIQELDGRWKLAFSLSDWECELPNSIRDLISTQIDQLSRADRRVLAAASILEHPFDANALAMALGMDVAEIDERLEALSNESGIVRRLVIRDIPNRGPTHLYTFVHALHKHAIEASLPATYRDSVRAALAAASIDGV